MDFLLVDAKNLLLERKVYRDADHALDHTFGEHTTVGAVSLRVGTTPLTAAFSDEALEDMTFDSGCYLARHLFVGNVLLSLQDGGPMDDGLVETVRKDLKFVSADYVRRKKREASA